MFALGVSGLPVMSSEEGGGIRKISSASLGRMAMGVMV